MNKRSYRLTFTGKIVVLQLTLILVGTLFGFILGLYNQKKRLNVLNNKNKNMEVYNKSCHIEIEY